MGKLVVLLLLASMSLAGCASPPPPVKPALVIPGDIKSCKAEEGKWYCKPMWRPAEIYVIRADGKKERRLSDEECPGYCVVKTTDGGKECTSSMDCQGQCRPDYPPRTVRKSLFGPLVPVGRCADDSEFSGTVLENGEARTIVY